MAYEQFIDRNFSEGSRAIIAQADTIIRAYQRDGFTLTLRQLYYQFVARDLLPNKQSEYKRLGSIINDARMAGLLDWDGIEDRTRNLETHTAWDSPSQIIDAVARQYKENPWNEQSYYCEVWIEKEALVGVIEPVCDRFRVPYIACRGYISQSESYAAGKRFKEKIEDGKHVRVFHLGDHDPSGVDMTRDNQERLNLFSGEFVKVERLALNMSQIGKYKPPPNPAKESDSRADGYIEKFGDSSWELDALDPKVIDRMISKAIEELIDPEEWEETMAREKRQREMLSGVSDKWDEVIAPMFGGEE